MYIYLKDLKVLKKQLAEPLKKTLAIPTSV